MTVTIKDVAKLAGVNASTVSRAIHDSKAISDKTKEKVKKAMLELGYSRNAAAQTLASGKNRRGCGGCEIDNFLTYRQE